MKISLSATPLTKENFKPYGDVIETRDSKHFTINGGSTERYHDLAKVDVTDQQGHPLINIFRAQPLARPFRVSLMERHPLGSQAFIPLCNTPFLILVAAAGTEIDPQTLQLFISDGTQGINYRKDAWHHPVLAMKPDQDFLVIDRGGDGENCIEYYFPQDVEIILP